MVGRVLQINVSVAACALCQYDRWRNESNRMCAGCPIRERTGRTSCVGTPYHRVCRAKDRVLRQFNEFEVEGGMRLVAREDLLEAIEEQIAFLESLREAPAQADGSLLSSVKEVLSMGGLRRGCVTCVRLHGCKMAGDSCGKRNGYRYWSPWNADERQATNGKAQYACPVVGQGEVCLPVREFVRETADAWLLVVGRPKGVEGSLLVRSSLAAKWWPKSQCRLRHDRAGVFLYTPEWLAKVKGVEQV